MRFNLSKIVYLLSFLLFILLSTVVDGKSLRKHDNVTLFYQKISPGCVKLGLKYNVPPAAILAIAGLESGYGSGYVSQITGNILSLGAKGDDPELPPLKLARNLKTGKLVYDSEEIRAMGKGNYRLEQRPASLKKDYRPSRLAGTSRDLAYFKYHPNEEVRANMQCIEDFMKKWLSVNTRSLVYREARLYLDEIVKSKGVDALFDEQVNKRFIRMIGGRPNSFNYRKVWPSKVISILDKAGLVELCKNLRGGSMSFAEAWGHSVKVTHPQHYSAPTRRTPVKNVITRQSNYSRKARVTKYDAMIKNISDYNSFPYELALSLINHCSGFNPKKVSSDGRYGLMQISISQAQTWAKANYYSLNSVKQLLEPVLNVRIGLWVLAQSRNYWSAYGENAYALALCEYKLGRAEMMNHIVYDNKNRRVIINEPKLFRFVNSVVRDCYRYKSN